MITGTSRQKKGGFTLIEMLVVVAVLGILAALLFPAIGSARGRAQTSGCASNLRQIGVAANAYAMDNGGRLPPYSIDPDYAKTVLNGNVAQYWSDKMFLGNYLGNQRSYGLLDTNRPTGALICPADTQQRAPHRPTQPELYPSYAYNAMIHPPYPKAAWGTTVTLATLPTGLGRFSRPAKTMFLVDGAWLTFHPGYGNNPPCYGVTEPFNSNQFSPGDPTSINNWVRRHGGQRGANMLFLDGHVEYTEDMKRLLDDGQLVFGPDS